jgi:hypothetical protein
MITFACVLELRAINQESQPDREASSINQLTVIGSSVKTPKERLNVEDPVT